MKPSTWKFVLVFSGWAAISDKLNNPELVMEVIEKLAQRLGMKGNILNPYCTKMIHPDHRRTFVASGIVGYSGTVLLDTFPGRLSLKLRVFSSRGLKGFQKTVQELLSEAFDLSGYEVDVHKLENLQ